MKAAKLIKQINCTCELVTTIKLVHPKPGIELKEQQSSLSFPNVGPGLQCWECVHASTFDLPWEKSMFSLTNPEKSWNPSGWPAMRSWTAWCMRLDGCSIGHNIGFAIFESIHCNWEFRSDTHYTWGKVTLAALQKSSLHAPQVGSRESQHPSRLGRVQTLWSDMMMWWQWVWVSHPSTLSDP